MAVVGEPNQGVLVTLNASARNCRRMSSVKLNVLNRDAFTWCGRGIRIPGRKGLKVASSYGLWMRQAAGYEGLMQFWRAPVKAIVHVLNWALKRSAVSMEGLMPVEIAPPAQVVVDV